MRNTTIKTVSLLSILSVTVAFAPPNLFRGPPKGVDLKRHPKAELQSPMNPGPVQFPVAGRPGDQDADDGSLTISDILPKTRSINIFASLTRDISSVAGRLESTENTTLLAPLNSAMQALPRKPWEDRPGDASGVSAATNEDKAAQNLQKFVEEHMVPISPWKEGKDGKIKTLGGQELWWERRDEQRLIMPRNLVVDGVVGRVGNGEIWAIKGVVNYQ